MGKSLYEKRKEKYGCMHRQGTYVKTKQEAKLHCRFCGGEIVLLLPVRARAWSGPGQEVLTA